MQNLFTLGGIQRVLTTILNELIKDTSYDITVVMPFQLRGERFFQIDERIKLKDEDELSINQKHMLIKYIFALNKRLGFFNRKIWIPFILANRIAAKGNYIAYFNKEEFDIVIGAGVEYSLLLGEISQEVTASVVGWQHSTYDAYFERRGLNGYGLREYVKKCYSQLDDVWVLTNADKREFDNKLGIKSKVFYNPLPQNSGIRTTYEDVGAIFVGRLDRNPKGLDYLIDVARKVTAEIPDFHIKVVGDGPDRNWLEGEIRKAGLDKKIRLVGATNNVYRFYSEASIMVQTSRWEGFGMTILEAMSCGVPVVAFHNYGPDEIIRDSIDGFLINQYNTEQFAKKVVEILKQTELKKEMGKHAIERSQDFRLEKLLPLFKKNLEEGVRG